jgi:hypothetical protein
MSTCSCSTFVAGAVVALVLGTGTAYAANAGARIGRSDSATAIFISTNTYGSAPRLDPQTEQRCHCG